MKNSETHDVGIKSRLLLTFDERNDFNRPAQSAKPEPGIVHHFMSGTAACWRAEGEIGGRPPARLDCETLLRHGPHLRMPDYQSIGAWRDIGDRKSPRSIRDGIVRVVNGKGPAFHGAWVITYLLRQPDEPERERHGKVPFWRCELPLLSNLILVRLDAGAQSARPVREIAGPRR